MIPVDVEVLGTLTTTGIVPLLSIKETFFAPAMAVLSIRKFPPVGLMN